MQPIAYFSAEYAFDDLPIFAGGLGVLAVDYLLEVAQSKQPFVMVGLFYHHGFEAAGDRELSRLDIERDGWSIVQIDGQAFAGVIEINNQAIHYQAWSKQFGSATVYLIDADVEANTQELRQLTSRLYDKAFETKVLQDALLGMGGVMLLDALKITPRLYHLNEGHSALSTLALLTLHRRQKPHATLPELIEGIREQVVATKHTILSAAGLYIHREVFARMFESYLAASQLPLEEVFALAQDPIRKDEFSTTRLMLEMSRDRNAVSELHAVYEKRTHPESPYNLSAITNGINLPRWQDAAVAAAQTSGELWSAHTAARHRLVEFVNQRTNSQLDSDVLTVVWARRITAYKRPLELFQDIAALQHIMAKEHHPLQVIIAGKPNVEDEVGVDMARQLGEHAYNVDFDGRIVYFQDYDLSIAHYLVEGADVWLNTPERGYEASGTSGMKAGANGVLQCSVSDGWVDEIDLATLGWKLPEVNTADAIYGYLEHAIAPLFYERNEASIPEGWCELMQQTIDLIEQQFTTKRMYEDYQSKLYRIA